MDGNQRSGDAKAWVKAIDPAAWRGRRVLVVAPHQDDEAFGAGGTAYLAARAGAEVHVVIAARGDGGITGGVTPEVREAESTRCCELLGTRPPVFLRVPSVQLREDPVGAGRAAAAALGARFDVLLVPSPLERHATHQATLLAALCGDLGTTEAEWWGWCVWSDTPVAPGTGEVDVTEARSPKTLAMAAHVSQNANRKLAAGQSARDYATAIFARMTGEEPRKAVERLIDCSALGRRRPVPSTAAEARERAAAFAREWLARWGASVWG